MAFIVAWNRGGEQAVAVCKVVPVASMAPEVPPSACMHQGGRALMYMPHLERWSNFFERMPSAQGEATVPTVKDVDDGLRF